MPYVPPHKRHSNEPVRPSPVPASVLSKFSRNLHLGGRKNTNDQPTRISYAENCIFRWFYVGSDGTEDEIPPSVKLVPVSIDSSEWRYGRKPLVLVNTDVGERDSKIDATVDRTPWLSVAEKVEDNIFMAFELAKGGMAHDGSLVEKKPRLVARFGKILFHDHPSFSLESLRDGLVPERAVMKSKKSFYASVPASYMDNIRNAAVLKLGFRCMEEKDIYYVILSDERRPNLAISCKCTVKEDKRLNMYRVEIKPVRNCVVDISCLDLNMDLRLMVYSKRQPSAQTDNELCDIRKLIDSAVIDPDVKGGLRWPLGMASSGGRYNVCMAWHHIVTIYRSPTLRLKVREADRFDFTTGTGEAAREVNLVLKGIGQKLEEEEVERSSVSDMLKDALKLIWDHFLSADPYLV